MSESNDLYGARMPLLDKIKLFAEWAPMLGRLQAVAVAQTPHDRALAILDALQWAAGKTEQTTVDDEAIEHLESVLRTPEGKAAFEWFVSKVGGAL